MGSLVSALIIFVLYLIPVLAMVLTPLFFILARGKKGFIKWLKHFGFWVLEIILIILIFVVMEKPGWMGGLAGLPYAIPVAIILAIHVVFAFIQSIVWLSRRSGYEQESGFVRQQSNPSSQNSPQNKQVTKDDHNLRQTGF